MPKTTLTVGSDKHELYGMTQLGSSVVLIISQLRDVGKTKVKQVVFFGFMWYDECV